MIKRLFWGFLALSIAGALTTVAFLITSGVQYRIQEDQGLEPGYTPAWIVTGTEIGLWVFALGIVGFAVIGVIALTKRRGSNPTHPELPGSSGTGPIAPVRH